MNKYKLVLSALLLFINTVDVFAATNGVPALSVTAPNGQNSILIGSIHVGIEGLREPDKSIFNNAKRFVIEHYSLKVPGDDGSNVIAPWAKSLSEYEISVYYKRAQCAGLNREQAEALLKRPSIQLANLYAYTICDAQLRVSRDILLSKIKPKELPTDVLEDDNWVEAQRLLAEDDRNSAGLKWILARDPKVVLGEMREHLNNGEYESILEKCFLPVGHPVAIQKNKDLMITGRNIAWMPRLKRYLDDGHAVILVGAAHLAGEKGLVRLLQADGYAVKSINLPESHQVDDGRR